MKREVSNLGLSEVSIQPIFTHPTKKAHPKMRLLQLFSIQKDPRTYSTDTGCKRRGGIALRSALRSFPAGAGSGPRQPASGRHTGPSRHCPAWWWSTSPRGNFRVPCKYCREDTARLAADL